MRFLSLVGRKIKENKILTLIILVGFLLRYISVKPGYYYPHGDELLYSQAIYMIINKTLGLQTHYLGFPPLIPWIMIPVFLFIFIPGAWFLALLRHIGDIYIFVIPVLALVAMITFLFRRKVNMFRSFLYIVWVLLIITGSIIISKGTLFHNEILGKNWINALYWGRYITVLFGTGVIILTYKIVIDYFDNKRIALMAAFLTSINYRLVLNSHVGIPDMYNVFFLMLSMLMIGRLFRTPSFRNYIFAWLSIASTFLIKYQVHAFVPFIFAHFSVSLKGARDKLSGFLKVFFSKKVVIGGLLALAIVLLSHFYHFRNWDRVVELNRYQAVKYGIGRKIFDVFVVSYFYHVGIGNYLSLAAISGMLIAMLQGKYRIASLLLLSVLPTFIFIYLYYTGGGIFTRNLLSTLPVILIFSALFFDEIYILCKKIFINRNLAILFIGILFFLSSRESVYNSFVAAYNYSKVSPRELAQKWVDENIHGNVIYARYGGNPQPSDPDVQIVNLLPFPEAVSYEELRKENFNYAIIEFIWIRAPSLWWTRQGLPMSFKFWNKPDDLLSQDYLVLALRELIWKYGLGLFISPWQAPTNHYAVVEIPKNTFSGKLETIKQYRTFNSDWKPLSYLPGDRNLLKVLPVSNKTAFLGIDKVHSIPAGVRWQSIPFEVKPNHFYKIAGKVENKDEVKKNERAAFLRIDFYNKLPDEEVTSRPIISYVSKRLYGDPGTQELTAEGIAPDNAKYAVIGFQGNNVVSSFTLKQLEILMSTDSVNDNGSHLTIKDGDLFLPNDEGIL